MPGLAFVQQNDRLQQDSRGRAPHPQKPSCYTRNSLIYQEQLWEIGSLFYQRKVLGNRYLGCRALTAEVVVPRDANVGIQTSAKPLCASDPFLLA